MTRNQKIALGCGGAGCLGLIVVGVVGCLIWYFYYRASAEYDRYANINFNSNRTANLNSSANDNSDDSSSRSSSSADSSMSNDDKHKLFQAAAMTGDTELQRRVWVKIGIVEDDYTPGPKYEEFVGEHVAWSVRNYQWVSSMNSPEKGRAYVNEHLD
jgi:cytoskeletal protein RodZ